VNFLTRAQYNSDLSNIKRAVTKEVYQIQGFLDANTSELASTIEALARTETLVSVFATYSEFVISISLGIYCAQSHLILGNLLIENKTLVSASPVYTTFSSVNWETRAAKIASCFSGSGADSGSSKGKPPSRSSGSRKKKILRLYPSNRFPKYWSGFVRNLDLVAKPIVLSQEAREMINEKFERGMGSIDRVGKKSP
jgi:hypothetical protein